MFLPPRTTTKSQPDSHDGVFRGYRIQADQDGLMVTAPTIHVCEMQGMLGSPRSDRK